MIAALLFSMLALAEDDQKITLDLDGDGKTETVEVKDAMVHVGSAKVECGDMGCMVAAHDLSSSDKAKQFTVCQYGVRDEVDCSFYGYSGGKIVEYKLPEGTWASSMHTSGNNIVIVKNWSHRLYERIEKYRYEDGKLVHYPQPLYDAQRKKVHVDRTFSMLYAPEKGSKTIAGVRPDSDIHVLAEHGEKNGWLLVTLSSGISGWVHVDTLDSASDHRIMTQSAG